MARSINIASDHETPPPPPRMSRATRHPSSDKENGPPSAAKATKGSRNSVTGSSVSGPRRSQLNELAPQASQILHKKVLKDGVDKSKYDPEQSLQERRKIRKSYRNLTRNIEDNKAELLKPGNTGLLDTLLESERLFPQVRQTSDATLDSRVLLAVSETALKKIQNLNIGEHAGLSVDEFVGKCVSFMKSKNRPVPTRDADDSDEEEEQHYDDLDWAYLGCKAGFRGSCRVAAPDFMLGPLSIQKKIRVQKPRKQGLKKGHEKEKQVTEMDNSEIKESETSALTVVYKIRDVLEEYFEDHGLDEVNLFNVVVNPDSYSQTVENLFYVSFLAKEGKVSIWDNDDDIPVLALCEPATEVEFAKGDAKRVQMIFSMTMWEWSQVKEVFDIEEPIIPTRKEEKQVVSATGWYN